LEVRHVVTPQHGSPAVQEAVTYPESGFDQGFPGLEATDPVHAKATQALEGLDRRPCARTEDPVGIDGDAREHGCQAVLHVGDRVAAVADRQREAYR
jgi:hypothetical protein